MKVKFLYNFYFFVIIILINNLCITQAKAQQQNYFPVGVWCTNFANFVFQSGGTWHIQNEEKQRILDLGLSYLIACTDNANVEEAIINFCEENNGNIKATLERRPSDSFQIWTLSFTGDSNDPNWQNNVNNSYAELGNRFGSSIGLHSVLVGAENDINQPDR